MKGWAKSSGSRCVLVAISRVSLPHLCACINCTNNRLRAHAFDTALLLVLPTHVTGTGSRAGRDSFQLSEGEGVAHAAAFDGKRRGRTPQDARGGPGNSTP